MRILYFSDGEWGTKSLRALVSSRNVEILGVVLRTTPTDPSLANLAKQLGVPTYRPQNVNSPAFLRIVSALAPDLNVSVSYDQILKQKILGTASNGFINFHAGLLPFYRGRNILNWALINGETEIGITGHYVDRGIDTGDIILQRKLLVGWEDTYADLLEKTIETIPGLVVETVEAIAAGTASRIKQAHLTGTYFAARRPGDEWIDWADTSENVYNKIRAISSPAPGAQTTLDGSPVVIWKASYDPSWPKYTATPGEVVGRTESGCIVKTGDSTILIECAQASDHEAQTPRWRIGTRFGKNVDTTLSDLKDRVESLERALVEATRPIPEIA